MLSWLFLYFLEEVYTQMKSKKVASSLIIAASLLLPMSAVGAQEATQPSQQDNSNTQINSTSSVQPMDVWIEKYVRETHVIKFGKPIPKTIHYDRDGWRGEIGIEAIGEGPDYYIVTYGGYVGKFSDS